MALHHLPIPGSFFPTPPVAAPAFDNPEDYREQNDQQYDYDSYVWRSICRLRARFYSRQFRKEVAAVAIVNCLVSAITYVLVTL